MTTWTTQRKKKRKKRRKRLGEWRRIEKRPSTESFSYTDFMGRRYLRLYAFTFDSRIRKLDTGVDLVWNLEEKS